MKCPRCGSLNTRKAGSILAARGRVQRFECQQCWKKFHPSLLSIPVKGIEGYLDIETSQAGRGAGDFGIVYSWAIKTRGGEVISDVIRDSILKEEKRILVHLACVLPNYDRLYTWWGTGHDAPILRSRFEAQGMRFPAYMELFHTDLYFVPRFKFKLHSNSLDSVAEFFGIHGKTRVNPKVWNEAAYGNTEADREKALATILDHNIKDVLVTARVH